MKKFTTKLLMSIIGVAFAFVALGTSTYAWFAMNQEVAVTGMQISAKSDSTYLIIGSENNLTTVQRIYDIEVRAYSLISANSTQTISSQGVKITNYTFDTFGFVDMCLMLVVKRDRAALAGVLAPVCQTAAARIRHLIAAGGTVVAGDVNHLNDVVSLAAAHGQLHPFRQDRPFLMHAAAHGGNFPRHDGFGNIHHVFQQRVVPGMAGHFPQHLVFQVLNFCIKLMHNASSLRSN